MQLPTFSTPLSRPAVRAFTLIEILIVGALIALFSGIAIFSVQQMYDSNRRKAMFGEAQQLGTALQFAHDDIGFYPRPHLLGRPAHIAIAVPDTNFLRPGVDAYGFLDVVPVPSPLLSAARTKWQGPYMGFSEARAQMSQGQRGLVKMRLSDAQVLAFPKTSPLGDISLVDWPTDTWGNPYMIYQVVSVAAEGQSSDPQNPLGLRLINNPSESANYFNAVVSYGPNKVPGGASRDFFSDESIPEATKNIAQAFIDNVLLPGRLYIDGGGGGAIYTLRSMTGTGNASLEFTQFVTAFPRTIRANSNQPGEIGILDPGSDDIFWEF